MYSVIIGAFSTGLGSGVFDSVFFGIGFVSFLDEFTPTSSQLKVGSNFQLIFSALIANCEIKTPITKTNVLCINHYSAFTVDFVFGSTASRIA